MTTSKQGMWKRQKFILKTVILIIIFLFNGCVSSKATDVWNEKSDEQDGLSKSSNSSESTISNEQTEVSSTDDIPTISCGTFESSSDVSNESSIDTSNESSTTSEYSETSDNEFTDQTQKIVLYLTFDDGPSITNSRKIMQILKKHDIKATFFLVGDWAKQNPDIVQQMYDEGHNIGCHSMSHDINDIFNSIDNFVEDLNEWEKTIKDILGELPEYKLYRFPGGSTTANINGAGKDCFSELKDRGYYIYDWSAANCDKWFEKKQPNESLDEYIKRMLFETINICGGEKSTPCIVLMHETSNETVEMLDWALSTLQEQGYTFDTLDKLNLDYTFTTFE